MDAGGLLVGDGGGPVRLLRALCFGCAVLFPMGWLLAFEAIGRVTQIDPGYRLWRGDLIALYSLCIWLAIFAFIVRRAARPWLQKRRLAPGLCRRCGYDLRASPTRCPECGETVDANVASDADEAVKAAAGPSPHS